MSKLHTWNYHIVPTKQLRNEIERHIPRLNAEAMKAEQRADQGWKDLLAHRSALIRGVSPDAMLRRLHDIMRCNTAGVRADIADAILIACGLMIDHDTQIQTFPGTIKHALEMVDLRAESRGRKLTKEQRQRRAERLMRYRDRVIYPDGYTPNPVNIRYNQRRAERRMRNLIAASKKVAA